jgi:glucose dehydrogenase
MLYAVNALTGKSVTSFGDNGVVNVPLEALRLKQRALVDAAPESTGYIIAGSPTYADGSLYIGVASSENSISGGLIVALDAISGAVRWAFRTIPQDTSDDGWEIAKDTWSGTLRQGGGVWTAPAVDRELGLVYANVANPTPVFDGSVRKGTNLFTDSIVALRRDTGKLAWHYQAIHHDVWDWDLVTGPTLFDVTVGGRPVKALASLAKTCYVYALNRGNGAPLFPVVETAVPTTSDVPGEAIWPTQPIPYTARLVPQAPLCSTYPRTDNPELIERRRPMFHPYQVEQFVIVAPGLQGGPNRGSSSFSPRTGWLYVTGKNDAWSVKVKPLAGRMIKPSLGARGAYDTMDGEGPTGVTPTQSIAAFDPSTGELRWVTEVPGAGNGGNLVTAGNLLFQAVGHVVYALDAATGKRIASISVKPSLSSSPITYRARGQQYVAIGSGGMVLALGLP